MRVVLDTNVLVSGLLNPNGPPASILNLIVTGRITLLYDSRIIYEYSEVLCREKFGFKSGWIDGLIAYFYHEGEYISASPTREGFRDDDDRMFYEVAVSGKADFLVTGNMNHFPKDSRIVSPRDFIAKLT